MRPPPRPRPKDSEQGQPAKSQPARPAAPLPKQTPREVPRATSSAKAEAAQPSVETVIAPTVKSTSKPSAVRSSVSTGFAARLNERTRGQRRRRWIRFSVIGFTVLLILVAAWLAFFSPVFRLSADHVKITGQGTIIDPGAVEKVIVAEIDTPLTLIDTVGLRHRILDVPGVRDAVLTRQWPTGLLVELTVREPVAAVPDGSGFTLRDDLGDVVGRAKKVPKKLPVIEIPSGADTARTLEAAIFMLNVLPADLHREIKSISAATPDAVTMKFRDGATVLWGNQKDSDLKVRVFEVLRSAKETRDARVFDVSAPNAPITR